ncbi:heavy metal transporter [Neisseriaceae bacterium PsAf]|nr:heavy metal transporter [Neisseriaceae bacterium PsAf]
MSSTNLKIEGMTCQNCVNSIKGLLEKTNGVNKVDIDLESKNATIDFDPNTTNLNEITTVIEEAGFDPILE